jgi:hypothetical protein
VSAYVGSSKNLKDLKVLKDLKDLKDQHGLFTEQFPVSAHVGSSKNPTDLKDPTNAVTRPIEDTL